MVKVRVRLYVLDPETIFQAVGRAPEAHSYCLGADQGGLSSVMGTFNIDDQRCTFSQMRKLIDFQFINGMTRRTMLYQEIQCWARSSLNHAAWPAGALHQYYFGYFDQPDQPTPEVLPRHLENVLVAKVISLRAIGSDKTADLVLVPQSQLGPGGHEFANRYCTPEGEVDMGERDDYQDELLRSKFEEYEYGEATWDKPPYRKSDAYFESMKDEDDPDRPSKKFWL